MSLWRNVIRFLWRYFNSMCVGVGWQQLLKWPPSHVASTCVRLTEVFHGRHTLAMLTILSCYKIMKNIVHTCWTDAGTHSASIPAGTPRFQLYGDSSISLMTRHQIRGCKNNVCPPLRLWACHLYVHFIRGPLCRDAVLLSILGAARRGLLCLLEKKYTETLKTTSDQVLLI